MQHLCPIFLYSRKAITLCNNLQALYLRPDRDPELQRLSTNTTSPHSTFSSSHMQKMKVILAYVSHQACNISIKGLFKTKNKPFKSTVNSTFHYFSCTRAEWRNEQFTRKDQWEITEMPAREGRGGEESCYSN